MPNNGYFDIKRDNAIINAGGFPCQACLVGTPAAEQSPDPRYCQTCYDILFKETGMLSGGKRPAWLPKPQKPEEAGKKQYRIPQHGAGIMSTLESQKSEVDIIHPPVMSGAKGRFTCKTTSGKRGPKHRRLPEDLIRQLASEGMGSKAIADRLRAEPGVTVSYKTIQRILSGQRVMV